MFVKQSLYTSQLQIGNMSVLPLLCHTQLEIEDHYRVESEKIILQARTEESSKSENMCIFHHSLLKRNIKCSAILKLNTSEGLKFGHAECAEFFEREVFQLLTSVHLPVSSTENDLLNEISEVFSVEDNELLLAPCSEKEVKSIIDSSNLNAALGLDGIPGLIYSVCWDILKAPLLKMMLAVHNDKCPTKSKI